MGGQTDRIVIECKILHGGLERTIREGCDQTAHYMGRCGAREGHLLVFDRSDRPWEDKLFRQRKEVRGKAVEVWGM